MSSTACFAITMLRCQQNNHSTALHFDKDAKQVFIDPSLFMQHVVDNTRINVFEYLSENHVWLGKDSSQVSVVDFVQRRSGIKGRKQDLQSLFSSPVKEDNVTEYTALNGCCTTVVVLVVWLCLRLGCNNPQMMVDAMRWVMYFVRNYDNETVLDFLLRLRTWQEQMAKMGLVSNKHFLHFNFHIQTHIEQT